MKFYKGNPNLIYAGEELEYTKEQIEEIIKCKKSYEYFIYNYVFIKTKKGLCKPDIRDYQKRILKLVHTKNRGMVLAGRQCGKTTSISMYIVWLICFHSYKTAGIVANKGAVSKEILDRIKETFLNVPLWLKPGVEEWNKTSIKLDNKSVVVTSACSADSFTSYSLNFLYVDEVAKIPKNKVQDFFDSVLPTVEADENAKIVCSSTPKGLNIWYKMWTDAVSGRSGYATVKVEWWEPPGRTKEWRLAKIAEKNLEYFNTEYSCEFLGSSSTLISGNKLKSLAIKTPLHEEYANKFKIYEKPIKNQQYVLIADIGEGLGKDFSTIQVIKLSDNYDQVAVYKDNETKPFSFHLIIDKIGKLYNNALVIVERNSCGAEVLNNLHYDLSYENIFYDREEFGIRTTKATKSKGCSNLSFLMESEKLQVCDYDTINELSRFVYNGKSYAAQDYDDHDDLVMPLVIFAWFIMSDEAERWLDINYVKEINKDKSEELEFSSPFFSSEMEEESDGIDYSVYKSINNW